MSRRDVTRANTIEKQQSKRAAELNIQPTPVASGPSGNTTTSASRASPVRILLAALEATARLALYACLLVALVALAVYIDTHNPGLWVPVWRLKTFDLADVPASLARFARTVAADAAKATAPTMATLARRRRLCGSARRRRRRRRATRARGSRAWRSRSGSEKGGRERVCNAKRTGTRDARTSLLANMPRAGGRVPADAVMFRRRRENGIVDDDCRRCFGSGSSMVGRAIAALRAAGGGDGIPGLGVGEP